MSRMKDVEAIPQTTTSTGFDATRLAQVSYHLRGNNKNSSPSNWNIKPNPEDKEGLTIIATSYSDGTKFIGTPKEFSAMLRGE